jgi:ComF family protein
VDPARALCNGCDRALPRLGPTACPDPSPLAAISAACPYAGEIERWVQRFKYPAPGLAGLDAAAACLLGALLAEAAARAPGPAPEALVPVPLHPARLRARGFNPAAELAAPLARALGLPHARLLLERVRDTPSQTGLSRSQRRRNVAGAFRVRPGAHVPARVWLVDDVATTGSTLEEAARTLRRAGAGHIVGVCVARTPAPA